MAQSKEDWRARYATNYHTWKQDILDGKKVYKRPLGLVESSFDVDGTDYGGRADMNPLLTLEIRYTLLKQHFRRRIASAWANLRLQHVLLQSRVIDDEKTGKRNFVVPLYESEEEVLREAQRSIVWVENFYQELDGVEIHRHCLNVARIVDPSKCLSRLHVLPLAKLPNGNFELRFLIIMGHQISDGLSSYNWFNHFIRILNMPGSDISREIELFRSEESIASRYVAQNYSTSALSNART